MQLAVVRGGSVIDGLTIRSYRLPGQLVTSVVLLCAAFEGLAGPVVQFLTGPTPLGNRAAKARLVSVSLSLSQKNSIYPLFFAGLKRSLLFCSTHCRVFLGWVR